MIYFSLGLPYLLNRTSHSYSFTEELNLFKDNFTLSVMKVLTNKCYKKDNSRMLLHCFTKWFVIIKYEWCGSGTLISWRSPIKRILGFVTCAQRTRLTFQ